MRVRVPGPRPSRPRPALAAPVAPPLTSGPAPSSARNAGAAPLGRRASERAAQGPRGRLGPPRRPPPLPPLGLSGPRAGAASREDGAALPGQCALRRGSPLRRPGNQATRRGSEDRGPRTAAEAAASRTPRPGDPGTGLGCTPRARAGRRGGPSPGAAGGGAEAGLGARPSAEEWMTGAATKGGFGGRPGAGITAAAPGSANTQLGRSS